MQQQKSTAAQKTKNTSLPLLYMQFSGPKVHLYFLQLSPPTIPRIIFFLRNWKGKVKVLAAQLCLTLCDPMDCGLPGSSVHGILQARILEWLPCPSPGDLPNQGIKLRSLALLAYSLYLSSPGSPDCCLKITRFP